MCLFKQCDRRSVIVFQKDCVVFFFVVAIATFNIDSTHNNDCGLLYNSLNKVQK